jgi:hypothetical protein
MPIGRPRHHRPSRSWRRLRLAVKRSARSPAPTSSGTITRDPDLAGNCALAMLAHTNAGQIRNSPCSSRGLPADQRRDPTRVGAPQHPRWRTTELRTPATDPSHGRKPRCG